MLSRVDDKKHRRFSQHFGAPSVRMLSIRGNVFVLLNSIAFEGDRCTMCKEAESQLQDITLKLDCSKVQTSLTLKALKYFMKKMIL